MKQLLLDLVYADKEEDVAGILNGFSASQDEANWHPYGDIKNNFGSIGNQQAEPVPALVEKLINSVDAVLIRKCLEFGIDPQGPNAPYSMKETVERFFGIKEGNLYNITPNERSQLAESIKLIETGSRKTPCLIVSDEGEGQTPENFPNTFLSLHGENKIRIPFVQGKFNMGGTGVLLFCGQKHNFQLILSRRHKSLWKGSTDRSWGFTLIRRRPPSGGARSSVYEYFAPNNRVPSFKVDALPILPSKYPDTYGQPQECGTFIKLYEYRVPSTGLTVLYDVLNRRLHRMALPIRMYERRKGYEAHSYETTLAGMAVRVEQDRTRSEIIEEGPIGNPLYIPDVGETKILMTLFKAGQGTRWLTPSECIFFTVNGQTHATLGSSFYKRSSVKLDYLNSDLMVEVDCSDIDPRVREDLFMASRDRMRRNDAQKAIEESLESELSSHPALREWNQKRREEALKERTTDERPIIDVLNELIKASPELASLFGAGIKLSNPYHSNSKEGKYQGKEFPTYFRLAKGESGKYVKECPLNSGCRVTCETDATNDYLVREKDQGKMECDPTQILIGPSLWNGKMTITLQPPASARVGQELRVKFSLSDISRVDPLQVEFTLKITSAVEKQTHRHTKNKKKSMQEELALPNIQRVTREDWVKYEMNEESALDFKSNGEDGLDAYVNIDNIHLQRELQKRKRGNEEPDLIKRQFELAVVVTGLAMREKLKDFENGEEILKSATAGIAKIIVPTIHVLGQIQDIMPRVEEPA